MNAGSIVLTRLRGRHSSPRLGISGFTLVELLVVMAVIGILIALLAPAIQWAREAARRAQCRNNLRQLAMGVSLYHDAQRVLPINLGPAPAQFASSEHVNGKGWIVSILPHIEQAALFDAFAPGFDGDFFAGRGIQDAKCREAVKTRLPVLQCPTDPSVRGLSTNQFQWQGIEVALTSYKGVLGDARIGGWSSMHPGTMPDCHSLGGCNGLFFRVTYREPQQFGQIHDGTSNTFLLGEDVPEHNYHSAAFYSNGDYASCHAPLNFFSDPPRPQDWWDVISFRSRHRGGANFAMADGSVHFVAESIDYVLYRALSTKAGNESASLP